MFYLACFHIAFIRYPKIDYSTLIIGVVIFALRFSVWQRKRQKNISSSITPMTELVSYQCNICGYIYDENLGDTDGGIPAGTRWEDIPESWKCPVCGVGKEGFTKIIRKGSAIASTTPEPTNTQKETPLEDDGRSYLRAYERTGENALEPDFRSIFEKAVTGKEEISAMGTKKNYRNLWEDIFFLPGQLATRVYDKHEVEVDLTTII